MANPLTLASAEDLAKGREGNRALLSDILSIPQTAYSNATENVQQIGQFAKDMATNPQARERFGQQFAAELKKPISQQDIQNAALSFAPGGMTLAGAPILASVTAYHGGAKAIEKFDVESRGSLTGATSAKKATWLTEDPKTAITYAVHASETGPVQAALKEAEKLEKIAQKTNKKSDWEKHDAKLAEAEKLDQSGASYERRQKMATIHTADIPDDANLLIVDAKGKTPWELSAESSKGDTIDSWLDKHITKAQKLGKAGVKFINLDDAINLSNRPATHYAIFDPSIVKITGKSLISEFKQLKSE